MTSDNKSDISNFLQQQVDEFNAYWNDIDDPKITEQYAQEHLKLFADKLYYDWKEAQFKKDIESKIKSDEVTQ